MQARLWPYPTNNRTFVAACILPLNTPPLDSLELYSSRRKSWLFEPISEEPSPHSAVAEVEHTRHHRQRAPPPRSQSAPQLISTTTTLPVYIKFVRFASSIPSLIFFPSSMSSSSLMPRSDSFNARVRGTSHIDFKTATTGVAAKAMRNEISRLVATVEDAATKKVNLSRGTHQSRFQRSAGIRYRDAILFLSLYTLSF